MKPIRFPLLGIAISLAAIGSAVSAHAAPIENWIVSITNSWSNVAFASSGPGSLAPEDAFGVFDTLPDGSDPRNLSYDVISWGTPRSDRGRSFLGVDQTVSLAGLRTNDATGVVGSSLYHGNYIQAASTAQNPAERWLDSALLNLEITLTPEGDTTRTTTFNHSIPIDFTETLNTSNLGSCPGGPWAIGTAPCPDSIVTTTEATSFSFVLDDFRYFLTLLLDPANSQNVLQTEVTENTATLWTAEGTRSRLSTRLAITDQPINGPSPVPEPGAIGLTAVGLALLGLAQRRRRARPAS